MTRIDRKDLGFRIGTGIFGLVLVLFVVAIGYRAGSSVVALDPEVRLQLLAHRQLGSRGGRIWCAPVPLGHALLVDPGARDCDASRARNRHLHFGALSGALAHTARLSHRAARGDSLDCVRTVGHLRPGAAGSGVRSVAARSAPSASDLHRAAARRRHARRRR